MSLKRTLVLLALVLTLLLPAALSLKNQNPWNCFVYTVDESFFAQAAASWAEGRGYRLAGMKPFDPQITVGIPMAWGSSAIRAITGDEIADSGRLFVYFTFILTLLVLGRSAFKLGRQWLAAPFAIGIFTYGLSKIAFGGYITFGFLGEMPGILCGALAYRALDEKKFFRAGLFAVGTFVMKPTFLFFLPAVAVAALLQSRKATARTWLAMASGLLLMFFEIARAREESILEYLGVFLAGSTKIAQTATGGSVIDLYTGGTTVPALFAIAFLAYGGLALAFRRRKAPSVNAAFLLFAMSGLYYLVVGIRPVQKQWEAVFALALAGFAVPWAAAIADRLAGFTPRELTRAVVVTVVSTWVLSVGQLALHHYKRVPETECAQKEVTSLNRTLRRLADSGEVTPENLGVLMPTINYDMSLYDLKWNPRYLRKWSDFGGSLPRWIYGETRALFPEPFGCRAYWKGFTFSVLVCDGPRSPGKVRPRATPPESRGGGPAGASGSRG